MQGNSGVQNTIFPAFFNIQPKNNRETQKKRDGASRLVSSILNDGSLSTSVGETITH